MKLTGNAAACYVTRLFEQFGGTEISEDKEQVIKETSAVLYAGKSESQNVGDEKLTFSIAGTDSVRDSLFSSIVCLMLPADIFDLQLLFPCVYYSSRGS